VRRARLLERDEDTVATELLRVSVIVGGRLVLRHLLRRTESLIDVAVDAQRVACEIPQAIVTGSRRHHQLGQPGAGSRTLTGDFGGNRGVGRFLGRKSRHLGQQQLTIDHPLQRHVLGRPLDDTQATRRLQLRQRDGGAADAGHDPVE
jgi:hypothetical protein